MILTLTGFLAVLITFVIMLLFLFIRANWLITVSTPTPLERGYSVLGKTHTTFSVQYFSLMLLFLILDLEVIFVISLISTGFIGALSSLVLLVFIGTTL